MAHVPSFLVGRLAEEIIEGPLFGGALDDDFYKVTMGAYIHRFWPSVEARFGLTNRTTSERLAEIIPERELVDALTDRRDTWRHNASDLAYLRGIDVYGDRMFPEAYLQHLKEMRLPEYSLGVDRNSGQFDLTVEGPWLPASRWEIPQLAIVNQLRNRAILRGMKPSERDAVIATGIQRLHAKIAKLKEYPDLTFTDFGTRRRFSRAWQRYVIQTLAEQVPDQFLGTSNTEAAHEFGLTPMGTSAHELFMVVAAILSLDGDDGLLGSHNRVLREWWELYGVGLSIALTDTFGTDFFFRDMTAEQARQWKGLRQDSGDPLEFAEKAIAFYKQHGINPLDKLLIFSDGLDIDKILMLWNALEGRIKRTNGWGTNLTNDLGIKPISIVVKAWAARMPGGPWASTVKLSDNKNKHLGDPDDVARYKRVFGYDNDFAEECLV